MMSILTSKSTFLMSICRDRLPDQPEWLHQCLQEEEGGRVGGGRGRAHGEQFEIALHVIAVAM